MFKYAGTALLMTFLAGCGGGSGNGSEQNAAANSVTSSSTGASTTGASASGTTSTGTGTYVSAGVTVTFTNITSTGASSIVLGAPGTSTVTQAGATVLPVGPTVTALTLPATRTAGQLFIINLSVRAATQGFATITGLSAGDTIKTALPITDSTWLATGKNATASFDANEVQVSDPSTASLSDYANYGVRTVAVNAGDAAWFLYNGDTYLIENMTGQEYNFNGGTDLLVKLTGSVNLANASIVDGAVVLQ